jgi:hypothetical protein
MLVRRLLARPTRRVAMGLVSLVAASTVAVASAPAASADTDLFDSFESGTASAWSVFSNVSISPAAARSGSYGVRAVTNPLESGFLTWNRSDVTQGKRWARVSGWMRIASCDCSDNVGFLNIKNANGVNHFDLWRDKSSGTFRYDLLDRDNEYSTMKVDVGEWYFVEVLVDFGGDDGSTYVARLRINGETQPSIRSTDQVGTSVRSVWFGGPTAFKSFTKDYDNLNLDLSDSPLYFTR